MTAPVIPLAAPLVLAPMAGVCDGPFRAVCLALGAGLAVGEMVSSEERLWSRDQSRERFRPAPGESFPVVQLLGSDPLVMARAAARAQRLGAAAIDLNFGCPSGAVCARGGGAALLRDPERAARIAREVIGAVTVPVSVKTRAGWDEADRGSTELARAVVDQGVAQLAIHGRTRRQGFSGRAEHDSAAAVARAVAVPVLANGDIDSPAEALRVLRRTGAAGVMIGRAALGDPWLFSRAREALAGRPDPGEPAPAETLRVLLWHLDLHLAWGEEPPAARLRSFRKHLTAYLRRLPGAPAAPPELLLAGTRDELADRLGALCGRWL